MRTSNTNWLMSLCMLNWASMASMWKIAILLIARGPPPAPNNNQVFHFEVSFLSPQYLERVFELPAPEWRLERLEMRGRSFSMEQFVSAMSKVDKTKFSTPTPDNLAVAYYVRNSESDPDAEAMSQERASAVSRSRNSAGGSSSAPADPFEDEPTGHPSFDLPAATAAAGTGAGGPCVATLELLVR